MSANRRSQRRLLCLLLLCCASASAEITIYTARLIRTMDPSMPTATAVAVEDGRILSVGSLDALTPLLEDPSDHIDTQFADAVLLPGFIDPHVHPMLPAVLTQFPFLAPDDWQLPTGDFPAARTPEAYRTALVEQVRSHDDPAVPFVSWGYHPLWHGALWREDLNQLFGDQPVLLWHRSFHELIGNDAAWNRLGITEQDAIAVGEADWARGHFYEGGLKAVAPKLTFIFEPTRFARGLQNFLEMMHQAGVTTALDMGTGIFGNPDLEINSIRAIAEQSPVGVRIILTPLILDFIARGIGPDQALAEIRRWQAQDTPRVSVGNHFKLMLDGAIFSGLAQMGEPGYLDGHEGVWMASRETTQAYAEVMWRASIQLHAHSNGDAATDWFLDLLDTLQSQRPRADHRTTLEHFAYSTEVQSQRLKALGALVSANPYYHYILSDMYADRWLGPERAFEMVRLGSLERQQVPFALHSDSPMAPLSPLTLMWSAVARETMGGRAGLRTQQLSREAALRAVTIDAAFILGREQDLGSIRTGKIADFTVLADDPLTVELDALPTLPVIATIFSGTPHHVSRSSLGARD
jgi:predicted amidohydrolase YtcJ